MDVTIVVYVEPLKDRWQMHRNWNSRICGVFFFFLHEVEWTSVNEYPVNRIKRINNLWPVCHSPEHHEKSHHAHGPINCKAFSVPLSASVCWDWAHKHVQLKPIKHGEHCSCVSEAKCCPSADASMAWRVRFQKVCNQILWWFHVIMFNS